MSSSHESSDDVDRPDGSVDDPAADDAGVEPAERGDLRYLSLDWIRALSAEVDASDHLAEIAQQYAIGVTQIVTEGPEGDVTYHLDVRNGTASFGAGPADPEDVKMQQSWDTAIAVATGSLNAQEAFISGRILLFGDQQKLLEAQPVFGALDNVFATVRERTRFE